MDLPLPVSSEAVPWRRRAVCFFDRGGETAVLWRVGNWESKAGEKGERGSGGWSGGSYHRSSQRRDQDGDELRRRPGVLFLSHLFFIYSTIILTKIVILLKICLIYNFLYNRMNILNLHRFISDIRIILQAHIFS